MELYAQDRKLRTRQIASDALVVLWVAGWALLGRALHRLVSRLGGAGRFLEDAGQDFARSAGGTGERVDDLPVLGNRLASPFGAVADGGSAVARAGVAQQDAVSTLAMVLALLVALLPIAWLLARYLPGRIRWTRDATAARALLADGDHRLFALRALAHQPLDRLRRIAPDPAASYERGDPDVVAALADLELGPLGLDARSGAITRRQAAP
jgi:hypothetical protein